MAKVDPMKKRRYNLCYRARKKGYKIIKKKKMVYRRDMIDEKLEKNMSLFGFNVQLTMFENE